MIKKKTPFQSEWVFKMFFCTILSDSLKYQKHINGNTCLLVLSNIYRR